MLPTSPSVAQFVPLRTVQRFAHRVEDDGYSAAQQLVYQRADHVKAASPENNRLIREVLESGELSPHNREKLQRALEVEHEEDLAVSRAEGRRDLAHTYVKGINGTAEQMATGKQRGRLRRSLVRAVQPSLLSDGEGMS